MLSRRFKGLPDFRKKRRPTAQHRALAVELGKGEEIKKSMLKVGYAPNTANRGIAGVPKVVLALMPKDVPLIDLGRISATHQEEIVRGRLVYNTLTGSDKGVLSAKALGSDRRVNMFTPEVQTGIVVIAGPNQVLADKDKLLQAPEE